MAVGAAELPLERIVALCRRAARRGGGRDILGPPRVDGGDNLVRRRIDDADGVVEAVGDIETLAVGRESTPRGLWPTGIRATT